MTARDRSSAQHGSRWHQAATAAPEEFVGAADLLIADSARHDQPCLRRVANAEQRAALRSLPVGGRR